MDQREWTDRAACKGMDTNLFFEGNKSGGVTQWSAEVRNACYTCPVQVECLDWALVNENRGFWGGMTPVDRRRARKEAGISLKEAPTFIGNFLGVAATR